MLYANICKVKSSYVSSTKRGNKLNKKQLHND